MPPSEREVDFCKAKRRKEHTKINNNRYLIIVIATLLQSTSLTAPSRREPITIIVSIKNNRTLTGTVIFIWKSIKQKPIDYAISSNTTGTPFVPSKF